MKTNRVKWKDSSLNRYSYNMFLDLNNINPNEENSNNNENKSNNDFYNETSIQKPKEILDNREDLVQDTVEEPLPSLANEETSNKESSHAIEHVGNPDKVTAANASLQVLINEEVSDEVTPDKALSQVLENEDTSDEVSPTIAPSQVLENEEVSDEVTPDKVQTQSIVSKEPHVEKLLLKINKLKNSETKQITEEFIAPVRDTLNLKSFNAHSMGVEIVQFSEHSNFSKNALEYENIKKRFRYF